jgi:hypothetical protein
MNLEPKVFSANQLIEAVQSMGIIHQNFYLATA